MRLIIYVLPNHVPNAQDKNARQAISEWWWARPTLTQTDFGWCLNRGRGGAGGAYEFPFKALANCNASSHDHGML